jgi:phosphinothricin acetyltransferase
MIRAVRKADAAIIADIYNYYIKNTTITFEEQSIDAVEMLSRIEKITARYPWFVYEQEGQVIGYAYASSWKSRTAYRYNAELTIYLQPDQKGQGVGTILAKHVINLLREQKIHSVISVVTLPNQASAALHKKLGFQKIAVFKEVGYKFEQWLDVAYWQYLVI